jgi:glycosyltransferase involved in cell wall biosynthesis
MLPALTIAIPTWNRAQLLGQTLESLRVLRIPSGLRWEVLVCDNNSTDSTRAVVEAVQGLPVRYLFEERQGKSHALNRMADEAVGDWLIFTDDDVRFEADWIESYLAGIARYPGATMLGGQVLPWLARPVRGRAAYLLRTFPWVNAVLRFDDDTPMANAGGRMPYGNNMAVRREVVLAHRFDGNLTMRGGKRGAEDTDLIERLLKEGDEGWLLAASKVNHYIPPDRVGFRWFCKWQVGAGQYWLRDKGPAPRGRLGVRWWLWKLVATRAMQAVWRWRPGDPRKSYECLADALMHIGHARATDARRS